MKPTTTILKPSRLFQGVLTGLLASASVGSASAQIISVNFGANESSGGSGNISTSSSLTAGAVLVAGTGWNNAFNASGSTVTNALGAGRANLLDSTGADTSATVSWSSNNTWRSGSTGPTGTSLDGALTKGYLDDGGSQAHVTISNVPYLTYNVYTIIATDQTGAGENIDRNYRPYLINGTSYQGNNASGTLSTSTIAGTANWTGKSWTDDDALTQGSHYLKITGQSAGTLTVDGNAGQGTTGRGSIAGIQIENTYAGTLSYWDIDGGTAGAGGATPSGTWDGATSNWSVSSLGSVATGTWSSGQAAVFSAGTNGTGNYTVTVSGTQTADALWIQRGDVTLSGGTVNLTGSRIIKVSAGSLTLSSTLTADGAISASGNIALGSAQTVSTLFSHTAGTVSGSALTVASGGTLSVGSGSVISAPLTIDAGGTLSIAPSAPTNFTSIFTNTLSNSGAFVKNGAGALLVTTTFPAAAQGVAINAGALQVGNNDATGDISALGTIATVSGSGLDYRRSDATSLSTNFTGTGYVAINSVGGTTLTGSINLTGTGGTDTNGSIRVGQAVNNSVLTLNTGSNPVNVANLYVGEATGNSGTVNQQSGAVTVTGQMRVGHWGSETSTYNLSGGSLTLTGTPGGAPAGGGETNGVLYLGIDGTGVFNHNSGTVNAAALVLDNRGSTAGDDTYNLNGGTLTLGLGISTNTAGGTSAFNFNGGTLQAGASASGAFFSGIGAANVRDGGAIIDTNGRDIAFAQLLRHSTIGGDNATDGGLTKNGAGSLTLSGANTYTGNISVNTGTLVAAGGGSLGNFTTAGRTVTVNSGAALSFTTNNVFGNGVGNSNLPSVVLNSSTLSSTRYNVLGNVTLNGSTLTQAATDGPGTYEGYQFRGTITVGGSSASAILSTNGRSNHLGSNTTFDVADATGDAATDLTVSSGLKDQSGDFGSAAGALTKSGAGTLLLSGANTYTGGTNVNAGTATAGDIAAFGTGTITLASGATLDLAGLNVANTVVNNGGTLAGASGYTGPQTLTGTSSYAGTVGSTLTVASGGTLKGTATFTGAVTFDNGSVHAPGNSPGIETFSAGATYNSGSTLDWEFLGNTLAIRGTDYDGVDVTGGNLDVQSGAILALLGSGLDYSTTDWDSIRTFAVIDFSGGGSSTGDFTLDTTAAGAFAGQGSWSVANTSGDQILTWTPVPEPSTYAALAGLGVLGLAVLRRRKAGR